MLKNLFQTILLAGTMAFFALGTTSCSPSDATIKSNVEKAIQTNPDMTNMMVEVTDGVATISGECKDEMCKVQCEDLAKSVKGVKSVVNNCTVAPPAAPVMAAPPAVDTAMSKMPQTDTTHRKR